MGEYLSTPNREKKSEEGENGKVSASSPLILIKYINFLDKVWFVCDAGMAQEHGRRAYC